MICMLSSDMIHSAHLPQWLGCVDRLFKRKMHLSSLAIMMVMVSCGRYVAYVRRKSHRTSHVARRTSPCSSKQARHWLARSFFLVHSARCGSGRPNGGNRGGRRMLVSPLPSSASSSPVWRDFMKCTATEAIVQIWLLGRPLFLSFVPVPT